MTKLVFLAGIHGVGKNFLLDQTPFSEKVICLTASEVLGWHDIKEDPNDKRVDSITDTQELLIHNLEKIVNEGYLYILNGHLTLLNKNAQIERVPEYVFSRISPCAIVVKTAEPQVIYERVKDRDSNKWDIDTITQMQNEELKYGKELSTQLKIPFYQVQDNQNEVFEQIINTVIR